MSDMESLFFGKKYMGCFAINEEERLFISSPGDYDRNDISPLHCLRQCGRKYHYAALEDGDICLCANSLPNSTMALNDSECGKKCPGSDSWPNEAREWLRCGGERKISIYSASERILGLSLMNTGHLQVLKPVTISANLTNGMNVTFSFTLGDGSKSLEPSKVPQVRHIYDQPGSYIVSMTATNLVTGSVTVSQMYNIDDPMGHIELLCPHSVPLGSWIECNGSLIRGSRINNTFFFGDGSYESIPLSSRYYNAGPKIPRDNDTFYSIMPSPQGTIVSPAYEFRHDGTVTEFEFEGAKIGKLRLQIFRPRCDAGEKYCLSNKSCVEEGETCDPTYKKKCQPSEIFCIFRRRCIANITETRKACVPLVPHKTDVPRADYELIFENLITIDTLGHHIKTLPTNEQPSVRQGDVLGWISDGGDLAFREINPADGAAFEFEYHTNPQIGDTLLRSSNPSMYHRHYIVAAHYVHAADFVIRHLYKSTGVKHLISNITQTVLVAVDIPVGENVTMSHRSIVNTHESVVFDVPWHSGSNVTYIWDFGDGSSVRTQSNSTTYNYTSSGTFYIRLTVANSVNQKVLHSVIAAFDFIKGFTFSNPIKAKALGLSTEIKWEAAEGTNITFVVDFGDGSPRYEKATTLDGSRKCSTTHLYSAVGNYTVSVFAFNLVGPNISIISPAVVEIPVSEVEFSLPAAHVTQKVYFAVGDTVTVNRVVQNGTNVRCSFDFKDGTPPTVSIEYSTSHVYNRVGVYKVEITCYNAVNSVKRLLNATVVVQNIENITGLTLSANPAIFKNDSEIIVDMKTGTVFFCTLHFGDGDRLKIDYTHLREPLFHYYPAIGSYNISVKCHNRLGEAEFTGIHDVDIPIKGVTVTSQKRFIRVHESVAIDIRVKEGSRIRYVWDYNDGSTDTSYRTLAKQNELESSSHAFARPGAFPVRVTVSNSFSDVSLDLTDALVVEYPVANISLTTDSPIRLNPGIATLNLRLVADGTPPTNAVCVWNFADGSGLTQSAPFIISPSQLFVKTYTYTSEGIFTALVNISNNVSSLVLTADIDVQEIKDVSISVMRIEEGVRTEGFGRFKNFFRAMETVFFNVTMQAKDERYTWDFEDGSPRKVTSEPYTTHVYNRSGIYRTGVTVNNILATMNSTKDIVIEKAVEKISISASYPTYYGDPTYFTIHIEEPGTDTCLTLDFQDSHITFMGEPRCRPSLLPLNNKFLELNSNQTKVELTHEYDDMGSYPAKLSAFNTVSKKVASTLVNITTNPCNIPTVKIVGEDFKDPPQKIKKSEMLTLRHEVSYKCPVASSIVFTWGVFLVSYEDRSNESIPISDLSVNLVHNFTNPVTEYALRRADLLIKETKLPFGHIKFKLTVSFQGKDRDLSEFAGTDNVWIEVKRSEMTAVIRGSFKRSIGYQLLLKLDASDSKDPDFPNDKTGIEYTWMCKKVDEEFPETTALKVESGGCWENGTYVFGGNNEIASVFTGDFYQGTMYDFSVIVQKDTRKSHYDQRVEVLRGQPPTMVIEYVFNVLAKKNPFKRLIMESRCIDCKIDDRLEYQWKLSLLLEGAGKDDENSWEEKTDWTDYTQATGLKASSLIIEAGYLLPGRTYRLQLNAWRPGGYPGGYVIEEMVMNIAPTGGKCSVPVSEGFALETQFNVMCEEWSDPDVPLTYLIELKNGEEIVPLSAGLDNNMTSVFPLGKPEYNYTIEVRVKVMDAYLLSTETQFSVRVLEPVNVDYDQVFGDMEAAAGGEGGDQKAVQLAGAASSVLKAKAGKEGDDGAGERAAFRGKVAGQLSQLPVKDFDGVAMKGEALNSLTSATGEVDEDAQNATVNALGEMGDFLTSSDSARDVENVAKSLGSAIGNVVGASIDSYQKAANGTSSGDPSKSRNNTKNALGVVDKVSGALMKQLAAGDKPKSISSPNLDMSVGRKTIDDIGGENDDEDAEEGEGMGGVKLPDPMALFGGANASVEDGATSAIGSTLSAMDKNPFAWDNSSSDLNSKTVGLSLTDGNGKPLDLAGQQLEMFVPRNLKINPVKPMELNHYAEGDPPMRIHKFNRSSIEAAVAIEMKFFHPDIKFMVAVRYDKKPTANHYDFVHTFPTPTEAKKMKKRPHPFTYVIPHVLLNPLLIRGQNESNNGTDLSTLLANVTIKQFYLGVKAINKDALSNANTSYAMRIYLPSCKMFDEDKNTWTTKGCKVGPKTIANSTHCLCTPGEDEEEEVEEEFEATTEAPTVAASSGDSQPVKKVVQRRRFRKSVNKVNIASSMFVAPNPIDFNKVFNAKLAENPIALAVVCGIFGVYLILAIYARREDLKDVERAGVTPLEDNESFDQYHYEITVYTGFGKRAGTTAEVSFILSGDEGESEPRLLKDPKGKTFQRRGVDVFLATFPESFGELNYLHLWHNNGGRSPSWYVSRVVVHDLNNDKKFLFICESWLAVEEGDGAVDRLIPVAGLDEMTSFNHLFYSTTQKNLADGHLWFSVFMRPAKSRFTRLQRISCCLTLLYCSMITNAMFYQVGGESDPASTIQIGPLAFSPAQIGIGIMSSLIVVPVNLLIVGIFRNVEARPTKEELRERRSKRTCWWFQELFFCFFDFNKNNKNDFIEILQKDSRKEETFLDFSSKTNLAANDEILVAEGVESEDISFRISKQERKEEMEKKQKKKKKKKKKLLPYWFLYIGWVICFLTCFTTALFCVLYGLQFGKEKSAQWISSMLISFFQDVLISQPIKILAVALVIAIIIKKPAEEEEEEEGDKKKLDDEDWLHDGPRESGDRRMKPKTLIRLQPPDKSKLEKARQLRFKEMKMNAIVKEVALYVFFVACLCIVSYSHRDPTSFAFREEMYNSFVEGVHGGQKSFSAIGSRENFYQYAKTTLMNALYTTAWYNGDDTEPGFTADLSAYIVGMARLRQLRVKNYSCEVASDFTPYIDECNDWYGFFSEEKGQFDIGWEPLKNESLYIPPFTYQAWEFNTSDELDTLPVMGFVSTYGGGGFVAELGYTRENATKIIQILEENKWIDSQTRAVIVEIATYNPVVNLFCVMTLIVEFLPTNGVFLFTDLKIARLFTFGGGFESFLLACEFFILLFFAVFIYQELKQLYRLRKGYFKEFWNYIEFIMIILVFTCVGMFFTRTMLVSQAITSLEENPGKYVSFGRVASWNEVFMYMVSMVVFTAWIKGIKLLRFNRRITILAQTLRGSAGPLAAFSVVFLVFFLSYSLFAFAVFGKDISGFYNFVSTCETVMGILLGSFDYRAIEEAAPILGPIFFFTIMVFGTFILMNMFLTIVLDVFSEVKESIDDQENEYEIVDFMIRRFRKFTGMQPNKVMIDSEESMEKTDIEEETRKDLLALSNKKKLRARRKFKPMDLVAQRFTRLETSLSGFYCEEWAEERLLDHIVERRWGVNAEAAYAQADAELHEEQQVEQLRQDMYAAAERFDAGEGAINLNFEDDIFEPWNSTDA
ncbi:Polycystic kidney disease and receptor for egg jelly-related protein [Stylophora pistillata]|uniref:Polycystic kidney disease and receptor for egg jelly-related protein n=1 Tax=Stylophora pistillata TaxID=50429 RepID=A0A2B4RVU8_STYPI|nr:Polycystic kidney disease and receptor for egg jelly-related protein [Stylophora pistillata]